MAYAVAEHVENFNSRTDPPGSTALVPYPSEEYLKREKEKPYLSPLPNDILQAPQKWCVHAAGLVRALLHAVDGFRTQSG